MLFLSVFYFSSYTWSEFAPFSKGPQKKIIIIDPGHGGDDHGAIGSDGTKEKAICLALANILVKQLSDRYKVVLTRTGDYFINLLDRTAIANNNNGDLFIGLHLGGSFLHITNGTYIFYHESKADLNINLSYISNDTIITWNDIQKKYGRASSKLANILLKNLLEHKKRNQYRVKGASLPLLAGADMPAIIIEPFYITNPFDEKKNINQKSLLNYANKIVNGIDDFFFKNSN